MAATSKVAMSKIVVVAVVATTLVLQFSITLLLFCVSFQLATGGSRACLPMMVKNLSSYSFVLRGDAQEGRSRLPHLSSY